MAVKNNDSLIIDYTLTNTTDNEFVSSGETWGIQLGRGQMLPGFEAGMVGMEVDETKTITLTAANAWGAVNESLIQWVPSYAHVIKSGDTKDYPVGSVVPGGNATIVGITGDTCTLDFNLPLAGKDLSIVVTLKKINIFPTDV
jgi:FKBP-type peptidyl-prolyl cis-trans isomerase 2